MEVLEDDSKYIIKIVCRPKYLMLSTDLEDDFHLGDKVSIEGDYEITKIDPEID